MNFLKIILGLAILYGSGSEFVHAGRDLGTFFSPTIVLLVLAMIMLSAWLIGGGISGKEFRFKSKKYLIYLLISFAIFGLVVVGSIINGYADDNDFAKTSSSAEGNEAIDPIEKVKNVAIRIEVGTPAGAAKVLKIYRSRIESYFSKGLSFGIANRESDILIKFNGSIDTTNLRELLTKSGKFEIKETSDAFQLADSLKKMNEQLKSQLNLLDQFSFDSIDTEYPLYSIIYPAYLDNNNFNPAVIGYCKLKNKTLLHKLLENESLQKYIPSEIELMWCKNSVEGIDSTYRQLIATRRENKSKSIRNEMIEEASIDANNWGDLMVKIILKDDYASDWATITESNVDGYLALVIDDVVYSFPRVNEKIEGGRLALFGLSDQNECKLIAAILNSDPLPKSVTISSLQTQD